VKVCLLIPVYNHPHRIGALLDELARFGLPCVLVDDGSDAETRAVLDGLAKRLSWVVLERRGKNGGRGAALKTGYRCARALGYTHVLQLDADGQHSPAHVPTLLEAARKQPDAMVLGTPVFDDSVPAARLFGRQISRFWVWLETLSFGIDDPLCGLRLLPLEPVLRVIDRGCGDRMDFDPELVVRLHWAGVPVVNVATPVAYFEDGISHFRPLADNLRMTWLHTRLVLEMPRFLPRLIGRRLRGERQGSWHERKERGSELGMRIVVWLYRALGEPFARALVVGIVAYFFVTDPAGRRVSRAYLERVRRAGGGDAALPASPGLRHVFRHYMAFGLSILDRVGFWLGRRDAFALEVEGGEELDRVVADGRGAIVLGAHLGSFDVMRLHGAAASPIDIHILMYTRHAPRINRIFERLDQASGASGARVRVIPIVPGSFHHALEARACVERGQVVAVLADRPQPGALGRTCDVDLLGGRARLPRGPFALARALGCPVLLMQGIRLGWRRYQIRVVRLPDVRRSGGERAVSPRDAAIAGIAQQYAHWLGEGCKAAPYQWFNFHDV